MNFIKQAKVKQEAQISAQEGGDLCWEDSEEVMQVNDLAMDGGNLSL